MAQNLTALSVLWVFLVVMSFGYEGFFKPHLGPKAYGSNSQRFPKNCHYPHLVYHKESENLNEKMLWLLLKTNQILKNPHKTLVKGPEIR